MTIIPIGTPDDERLSDYTDLKDVHLRSVREPAEGLYMAESSAVIRRALAAGHRPRSLLMAEKWLDSLADVLADPGLIPPDTPVFVASEPVLQDITGFHLHRGALAAMHRPALPSVAEVLAGGGQAARRIAILEDIVDHTNVGAAFRSAAALGFDAVLITPRCADPLYRRSVRVSMGTVFQVPWTRLTTWPGGMAELQDAGFVVAALALSDQSVTLDEFAANPPEKLAVVLGTEGDGLAPRTLHAADVTVRIPMAGGVDSLNVAAASAVAFWALR
ncbi:MAG: RNA methyltransferase [Cellulomonadaceae bacterium]|jgi:tRNA G18 (ribose-2'-O)-methylase SpoU|nr:RNA methyltransferase [Cellulomonadaceae bacterium]